MNKLIFREYDIRGIVDQDLTEPGVILLGKGMGTYLLQHGARSVTLGRDGRTSSPKLRDWLTQGLTRTGLNVTDLGAIPTPLSYWSTHKLDVDGAIMITGSHNPPEYNGFKVTLNKEAIYGKEILKIRDIIDSGDYKSGHGSVSHQEIIQNYIDDLTARLKLSRPVRLAVDCGNGV